MSHARPASDWPPGAFSVHIAGIIGPAPLRPLARASERCTTAGEDVVCQTPTLQAFEPGGDFGAVETDSTSGRSRECFGEDLSQRLTFEIHIRFRVAHRRI